MSELSISDVSSKPLVDPKSQPAAVAPVKVKVDAAVPGPKPLEIAITARIGIRTLRGEPTAVPTGHLDIMVAGKQRAWTRVQPGTPIRALAEFLSHEIPQLQEAVRLHRGDTPEFRPLPKGTPEQIAALQRA